MNFEDLLNNCKDKKCEECSFFKENEYLWLMLLILLFSPKEKPTKIININLGDDNNV